VRFLSTSRRNSSASAAKQGTLASFMTNTFARFGADDLIVNEKGDARTTDPRRAGFLVSDGPRARESARQRQVCPDFRAVARITYRQGQRVRTHRSRRPMRRELDNRAWRLACAGRRADRRESQCGCVLARMVCAQSGRAVRGRGDHSRRGPGGRAPGVSQAAKRPAVSPAGSGHFHCAGRKSRSEAGVCERPGG
jgi:hypothetical protein